MVRVSGVPYDVDLPAKNNVAVGLVWSTDDMESLIAYMARISNPENQDNPNYEKLISYLIRHQHWSPFEMVSICMEINCTRDIARQILRHRSFSFQEFSQRYAKSTEFIVSEARLQDPNNRQASLETSDDVLRGSWYSDQSDVVKTCLRVYEDALRAGIAKEVARKVLPEGLTMSRMYMSGTLRSWIHYVQLRCGPETQKEHREVALECRKILEELCPTVMNAVYHHVR
jgi:thymidylate synthase (FAD)